METGINDIERIPAVAEKASQASKDATPYVNGAKTIIEHLTGGRDLNFCKEEVNVCIIKQANNTGVSQNFPEAWVHLESKYADALDQSELIGYLEKFISILS